MTGNGTNRPESDSLNRENPSRIGQLGNAKSVWDNGLYAKGVIGEVTVDFLVDSGSTATLLSKHSYDQIGIGGISDLHQRNIVMQGVDGKNINVYGCTDINISFDGSQMRHMVIVCDITPEGILGQDFLLEHIKTWDMDVPCLRTRQDTNIQLEMGGETQVACRVLVKDKTQIPAHSVSFVPVKIVSGDQLPNSAYMEGIEDKELAEKQITIVPGIVDPHNGDKGLAIMNNGEDSITFYPGAAVAKCNSSYEACDKTQGIRTVEAYNSEEVKVNDCGKSSEQVPSHLQDLFERSSELLDGDEKLHLAELLNKYQNVFARSSDDLGQTDRVKHKINTGTSSPIRQPPRRQPFGKRETEKQEISKMLEKGVIEPSNSPWASPIVLVTKKDGTTRFCVDYRKLNDVTVKDAYPLPRVDECLDALAGSKWFSCMDLNSGFWQIMVEAEDQPKTA
ncbi:MAG: reverse transcriptase family protein, partial [Candidatus Thiodiazotropha endolucinida]|nr:reverse transcriptase family protein [Candidatus Thiodiazotropha taylori]MCW4262723.1 reverse transcriptase family protein [Candidatus Thiodiazotropha endolucinida]